MDFVGKVGRVDMAWVGLVLVGTAVQDNFDEAEFDSFELDMPIGLGKWVGNVGRACSNYHRQNYYLWFGDVHRDFD